MTIQGYAMLSLKTLTIDQLFQRRHKRNSSAFSRNRKLSFETVVGMLLRMVKKSIQICCNWLGDLIGEEPASKQAFSQARHRISPACFQEMHEDGLRVNYSLIGEKGLWKGFRLIACDGSTLRLPESEDLENAFGRWPTHDDQGKSPPMARISEYTDMTAKLVLSGRITPCMISEEQLAAEQLTEVVDKMRKYGQSNLVFVYDRGYPSEAFIKQHLDLDVDFIFRVPKNFNGAVSEIYESKANETYLIGENWPLIRVSQFLLSSGETELLLTSLTDEERYSQEELSMVYHGRWTSMEEGYKKQKIMMQLENFSGKTEIAIQQEYWATLTVGNLIEMGCIELEGYWIPGELPQKQVNRSVVFGSTRDATIETIFGLMTQEEYNAKFARIAKRSMIKVRPGRNYSRENLKKPKKHHIYRRAC